MTVLESKRGPLCSSKKDFVPVTRKRRLRYVLDESLFA